MMSISSYMPTRIICGVNAVRNNQIIFSNAGKKCLIITGKNSAKKCGALKDVIDTLDNCSVAYEIFDEIKENPYVGDCYRAGRYAREINAEFIIGIGGGSVLDASKAAAIFASNCEMNENSIYCRAIPSERLPLFLVGTTAGTGSEVTGVSVLTDVNGFKKSISGADCYADVSFCDHTYTHTAGYDVTVSTALDAYAHALESYFSLTSNDISSLYAIRALELIWNNLLYLNDCKDILPDNKMREELYIASLYAGLAINVTGTAFPHTSGYILTEKFGIAHGKACTAFHPQLMDKAEKYRPDRLEAVCKLFGTDKDGINSVIRSLTDVHIQITEIEGKEYCSRWTSAVKNFDRTPGGYTPEEAVKGLLLLND